MVGGRYELGERLGQGAFSITYQGRDIKLGRIVAIKLLRPQFASDPQFVTRFEREARLAASVSNANIVDVYDYGPHDDTYFIAMQYVGGGDLKVLLDRERRIPAGHAAMLGHQILAGLSAIHGVGIIHRDIKPQNVLLGKQGEARLTDFGVAHASIEEGLTSHGTTVGTAAYMAPEQARGGTLSEATDLYAVGVLLFECLTGRLPFEASNPMAVMLAHIQRPVPSLREVAPDAAIPAAIEAIVLRAMAKDPSDRYATAVEMSDALAVATGEAPAGNSATTAVYPRAADDQGSTAVVAAARPPTMRPTPILPPLPRRTTRRRMAWLGPALFVLVTLFAVGAALAGTIGDQWGGGDGDGGGEGTSIANSAGDATPTAAPTTTRAVLGDISITGPTVTVTPSTPAATATEASIPTPPPSPRTTATATDTPTETATATASATETATASATATVTPLPTATRVPTSTSVPPIPTTAPPISTSTSTSTSPPMVPRAPTETAAAIETLGNDESQSGEVSNGGSGDDRPIANGGVGTSSGTGSVSFGAEDWAGACGGIDSARYGRDAVAIYGRQTSCASATLTFTLDDDPETTSVLTMQGFNGENIPISVGLEINGQSSSLTGQGSPFPVWNGDWGAVNRYWTLVEIRIPAEALRAGSNTVTISNQTDGSTTSRAPYFLLGEATLVVGSAMAEPIVGDAGDRSPGSLSETLAATGLAGRSRLRRGSAARLSRPRRTMPIRRTLRIMACDRCGYGRQGHRPVVR